MGVQLQLSNCNILSLITSNWAPTVWHLADFDEIHRVLSYHCLGNTLCCFPSHEDFNRYTIQKTHTCRTVLFVEDADEHMAEMLLAGHYF